MAAAPAAVRLHFSLQGRSFLLAKLTTKASLLSCIITTKHILGHSEVTVTRAGPVICEESV